MDIRLLSVTWFLDSPYGTFVAGDYIEVWLTPTFTFIVYKNGVSISSGASSEMPVGSWNYNGLPDSAYKFEFLYLASICNGTSLLSFSRIAAFPYLLKTTLSDHPTCTIPDPDEPLVCDLEFSVLPTSTPASTSTALDGTITATATSSNGAVKYKLNDDFINGYNDPSAQSSGAFTGLGPGIYQVFARDASNCLAVQTVEVFIETTSTYDTHYQLEFYDPIGNHIKAEILEKDYSGSVVDTIKGESMSPLIFDSRAEGEKDKFVSVIATTMTFRIVSTTNNEYVSLYTNDQEKYRLKVSIDDGGGYDEVWLGKVNIHQYEENYVSPPYGIKVIASDGLPLLKDIPFADATGGQLRGQYKVIKLISWMLAKIGIERNIRVAANMYASTMASTASDDPLDQAYVDVLRYYLFKDTPSCMDVLRMLLDPFGAQIIHYNGVWNIVRVEEKVDVYAYREFDENGVYVSNSTYDPVKDVQASSEANSLHWMNQDAIMEIQPGFGSLQLIYDLGKKPNLLFNGDFSVKKYSYFGWGPVSSDVTGNITFGFSQFEGQVADTTGFEVVANGNTVQRFIETVRDNNVALGFQADGAGSYLQSEILNLKIGNADQLRVEYVFRIAPLTANSPGSYPSFIYWKVKIMVRYGDYYLLSDGTWSTTETKIAYYVKANDADKWQTLTILAQTPDDSYYLGEEIQVQLFFPIANDPDFTSLATFKALDTNPGSVSLGEGFKTEWYDSVSGYTGFYELRRTTDAADDLNIVRPDDYNASTNPYQWVLQGSLFGGSGGQIQIIIDKIRFNILNGGRELPEVAALSTDMENENKLIINKIIYHGSLLQTGNTVLNFGLQVTPISVSFLGVNVPLNFFYSQNFFATVAYSAECGDIAFCGYFRNSAGVEFTNWTRDNIAELKNIEEIFLSMYTAQYNKPWQRISGSLVSHSILLTPIDSINDLTGGGNRKYYPPALSIDYYKNQYYGEFLELSDATDADGANAPAEFNLDFNLDYTS